MNKDNNFELPHNANIFVWLWCAFILGCCAVVLLGVTALAQIGKWMLGITAKDEDIRNFPVCNKSNVGN